MFMKCLAGLSILAITAGSMLAVPQEQPVQEDTTPFMKRKLDAARDIVSGLASEDYAKIGDSAQALSLLSYESDWNVLQTEAYLRLSSEFRGATQRLRDQADERNMDGATLAYFEVTLNCVRCHKYLRQQPGNR